MSASEDRVRREIAALKRRLGLGGAGGGDAGPWPEAGGPDRWTRLAAFAGADRPYDRALAAETLEFLARSRRRAKPASPRPEAAPFPARAPAGMAAGPEPAAAPARGVGAWLRAPWGGKTAPVPAAAALPAQHPGPALASPSAPPPARDAIGGIVPAETRREEGAGEDPSPRRPLPFRRRRRR